MITKLLLGLGVSLLVAGLTGCGGTSVDCSSKKAFNDSIEQLVLEAEKERSVTDLIKITAIIGVESTKASFSGKGLPQELCGLDADGILEYAKNKANEK